MKRFLGSWKDLERAHFLSKDIPLGLFSFGMAGINGTTTQKCWKTFSKVIFCHILTGSSVVRRTKGEEDFCQDDVVIR